MRFFETIDLETRKRSMQFLVIGGLAANLYGCPRDPADLDLMIGAPQREAWLNWFSEFDYTITLDFPQVAFAQTRAI